LEVVLDKHVVSIVDDDQSVRDATKKLLRLNGYVVHAFASAEDFLRSPKINETDCLVADVRMPGMGGLALQERLIARGREIPTIFVTAFPEDEARERALSRGAICFLNKPFDGLVLIRFIEQALSA
jgi:FixJ family two-component response regulator